MREGPTLFRVTLALLSGLLLWAAWFALAYALHGAQCAGSTGLSQTGGQIAQVALLLATLVIIILQARWVTQPQTASGLHRTARYLQVTAIVATAFVGVPIFVLAPC
ncbi:hypothetical protein [Blastomonas sp. AAP53]|uniref:hypothetical protein n=1 Tax=Blastomonas sp. AAP53 TaxID=1248760 RepID=UPI00058CA22F|nr:hypothetical protein [Blastomonas sp. AAP53]